MAAKIDRLGETKMMNCGMEATIIRYGGVRDIDVRFKDGTVVKNRRYSAFKKGEITNPNIKTFAKARLGETRMMKYGMAATIIRYGNTGDIDVRFGDGTIVKNRTYSAFKKGGMVNPNFNPRLGETNMMNCGIKATIIRYNTNKDIDVRFEDETVVEHKAYDAFKKGKIANPNIETFAEARLGETRMMNCGMEATIIRYGRSDDIDVRFEDETIVEHRRYEHFKRGGIVNPNFNQYLGETRMMNCGMEATIIRYENAMDIDVRFEDETVVEHKTYDAFKKGKIANPNIKAFAEARLGETRMMNCGMEAAIIRYGRYDDIDIRFEDGAVVEHKTYGTFKNGEISHSSISRGNGSKDFHGFICKRGFIDEDRTLYECICKHCGLEDVLTPQEMMEHEKSEHGEGK